jgi:hypothetical protein
MSSWLNEEEVVGVVVEEYNDLIISMMIII